MPDTLENEDATLTNEAALRLIKLQLARIDTLKKMLTNFKKDSVSRKNKVYVDQKLQRVTTIFNEFHSANEQLISIDLSTENHNLYIKVDVAIQFEEAYCDLRCALIERNNELNPGVETTTVNDTITEPKTTSYTQLSPMPTPVFSGKFIDWPSFSDSFNKLVHLNGSLSCIQRFHCLKEALPIDKDLDIHNMLMTDTNYQTAWQLLQSRYNNARILFAHHMNSLYQLPVIVKENSEDIKTMINAANVCINEFKRLSIPIDQCDHGIAHYLSTKLPNDTHKAWENHLGNKTDVPTFKELQEFLINRLFVIDAIENRSTAQSAVHKTQPTNQNQKKSQQQKSVPKFSHKTHSFHARNNSNVTHCFLCNQGHIIRRCPIFLSKDCFERKQIVDQRKLCINCLSNTHTLTQCTSAKNCYQCGQRHHTLLHFNSNTTNSTMQAVGPAQFQPKNPTNMVPNRESSSVAQRVSTNHTKLAVNHTHEYIQQSPTPRSPVLLATALVTLYNPVTNTKAIYRALIDQGSEGTIISEHVVQRLGLHRQTTHAEISGLNSNTTNKVKSVVNCLLLSCTESDFVGYVENAYVLKQLNITLPSQSITPQDWPHLKNLPLADPEYFLRKKIDILLGADVYAQIIMSQVQLGDKNQPIAQRTHLGWIISGPTSTALPAPTIRCHVNLVELETLVNKLYESEHISEEPVLSDQDRWCEEFFKSTHVRKSNGKYQVRLPFKSYYDPDQTLGRSKQIALNRFFHLERRLNKDDNLSSQYKAAIQDYFHLQQIAPATTTEQQTQTITSTSKPTFKSCVLPHHAVIKEESLTTKVRIVFDASAKTSNGRSLNDSLCTGPALQNDLPAVLLNWRLHKFVFIADIQKMYRCIDMHPDDAQFQRILWRNDGGEVQEFCLTTVTFGTASAPYTAIRVIHQLAADEKARFPLASKVLLEDMYVDDILSGGDTMEKTIVVRNQLIGILKTAGMELRKWASNTKETLASIPEEHQSCTSKTINHKDTVKTLGLIWHPANDNFTFHINVPQNVTSTKRAILSTIARIFDPIGLISPLTVAAKIILKDVVILMDYNIIPQRLIGKLDNIHKNFDLHTTRKLYQKIQHILKDIWTTRINSSTNMTSLGWDDTVPLHLHERWQSFCEELHQITNISIPRWLHTNSSLQSVQLHIFCDGSSSAYAAAVYLRIKQANTEIKINLITAKSRVTPTKPITIPRTELCAAVLASSLATWVKNNCPLIDSNTPIFYWSDATIVLYWLKGDINRWKPYVANRISKILSTSKAEQWNHVSTNDNPADCATRGLTPAQLSNFTLWWNGPKWLQQSEEHWPKLPLTINDELDIEEKPKLVKTHFNIATESIIYCYSNLYKLVRMNALILRFINNCQEKDKSKRRSGLIGVKELQQSLSQIIRLVQKEAFGDELARLQKKETISNQSKIANLSPFLDDAHVLRVRGRLTKSLLPYTRKHPMILPNNHHFTKLVIDAAHRNALHGGVQLTITLIRHQFWIVNARRVVSAQLRKCIRCFRNKPTTTAQLMGDLPLHRVNPPQRAFYATGVDYAGPIELKASRYRGNTTYKGYIAIFICLATKAIHLEAVTGLTSEHFICALQRFMGRRGFCHDIYSDCGTNFKGASTILEKDAKKIEETVVKKVAEQNIQWHFNPPYSPNFGGLWEANVKSTKHHLKRVVSGNRLTYEDLSTVLIRIEACLNSRPLCPLTSDVDDLGVLTPAHFLIGDSLLAPPDVQSAPKGLSKHYMELQRMWQQFWSRWSADWLSHLQTRPKWRNVETNLQLNELVIVKDDRLPPNEWVLGRIIEIHPGEDQLVRVVTVRTPTGIYKRSISKICRLPITQH